MRKRGFTAVELVLVIVVLAIVVSVTMWQVDKRRQAQLRVEGAGNLGVLYMHLSGYWDSQATAVVPVWPSLSTTPGQLVPELSGVHNRALLMSEHQSAFISPAHPDVEQMRKQAVANPESAITDDSYWYLGYDVYNEDMGLALIEAYKKAILDTGKPPTGDVIKVRPYDRGDGVMADELVRLGTSYDAYYPLRNIGPILIERPGLQKGGSNVLFFGGAVTFIPYPGKWPMTEKFIKALESLDELKE